MRVHPGTLLFCVTLYLLIGLGIFLKGFFPVKKGVSGYASLDDILPEPVGDEPTEGLDKTQNSTLSPVFGKLVFVLIDALRADFVFNTSATHMHKVASLLNQHGSHGSHSFLARAHPPTVTMPRIKALTSGSIPGFIDVVMNFDSKQLLEDNIIEQFHRAGKKIVFYGDDTWIKLFPGRFTRSEGTTSFFVTDYTEVDDNVTRHIHPEMGRDDWDVMILHYLGLDHIGHLAGPFSPLVQPKLNEMDNIVLQLQSKLVEMDKSSRLPSLLVVCGDHGMSDQGSHGGSSHSETATPLLMFGSAFHKHPDFNPEHSAEIYQIDMVPSLSLLFGLPIPANNLGVMQTVLFESMDIRQQLRSVQMNSDQLAKTFLQNSDDQEKEKAYLLYQQARQAHGNWLQTYSSTVSAAVLDKMGERVMNLYIKSMESMRSQLASSLSTYDMHAIVSGIVLIWLALVCASCGFHNQPIDVSTSLFVITSAVSTMLFNLAIHIFICTSKDGSDFLCRPNALSAILFCLVSLAYGISVPLLMSSFGAKWWTKYGVNSTVSHLELFLIIGTCVHTLSLLSSSYVEEEHQTWYFLTVSALILLGTGAVKRDSKTQNCERTNKTYTEKIKGNADIIKRVNTSKKEHNPTGDASYPQKHNAGTSTWVLVGAVCGVLICCRLLRLWNQTGMKFADRPDFGDWLVVPGNEGVLSLLVIAGCGCILVVVFMDESVSHLSFLLLTAGVTGVYLHRSATGALLLPGCYQTVTKGIPEAQWVYFIIFVLLADILFNTCLPVTQIFTKIYANGAKNEDANKSGSANSSSRGHEKQAAEHTVRVQSKLQTVWILLTLLLQRPHNIPMFALVIIQERAMSKLLMGHSQLTITGISLLYLWFGQASFYYQGNSNSIASVDVSAGYVGLTDYQPVMVTLLLLCSTYAGPIYWTLSLVKKLTENIAETSNDSITFSKRYWATSLRMVHTIVLTRALPLAVYSMLVTIQRFHLFVWTVFSPKLLYETVYTLVMFITGLVLVAMAAAHN